MPRSTGSNPALHAPRMHQATSDNVRLFEYMWKGKNKHGWGDSVGAVLRDERLEFWQIPCMVALCVFAFWAKDLATPMLHLGYGEKVSTVIYSLFHPGSGTHVFSNIVFPATLDLMCCVGVFVIAAYHVLTFRDAQTPQAVLKGALLALLAFFILVLAYQSLVLFSVALIGMLAVTVVVMMVISAFRRA